jgi:hypothetical protein
MEPHDELGIFPKECFGVYADCLNKKNMIESQSRVLCTFIKKMKLYFMNSCETIIFEELLNSPTATRPKFNTSNADVSKLFDFYNEHMSDDDEKKKFIVTNNLNVQYPEIDSITFLRNCYLLYNVSLRMECDVGLAILAYDAGKLKTQFKEDKQKYETENPGELQGFVEKLKGLNHKYFIPFDGSEDNLKNVIATLREVEKNSQRKVESLLGTGTGADTQLKLDLIKYDSILSVGDFAKCILGAPPAALDILAFMQSYLLSPQTTVVCATSSIFGGLSTPSGVREKIERLIGPFNDKIRTVVDAPGDTSIFTSTCPFIADNPKLGEDIMGVIRENTTKSAGTCKTQSETFLANIANNASKKKLTDIFVHMVVYACYGTMNAPNKWGAKGTDLMILFMNEFTVKFFNNVLLQSVAFYNARIGSSSSNANAQLMLIDKRAHAFFEFAEQIKNAILTLNLKGKTKDVKDEDLTTTLCGQLNTIKTAIASKITEASRFIEGLTQPPQPTVLDNMHDFNLLSQMAEECKKIVIKVTGVWDSKFPGKRDKWEQEQTALRPATSLTALAPFDPKSVTEPELTRTKDECKEILVSLISDARAYKKGDYVHSEDPNVYKPISFDENTLRQLNTCADARDVFNKGQNSKEHLKRISRASYALAEIWPYIDKTQKLMLLQLPSVNSLIEQSKNNDKFKRSIEEQCNDDGKAEQKFGVRWGMSDNRKSIMQHMNPSELAPTCQNNANFLQHIKPTQNTPNPPPSPSPPKNPDREWAELQWERDLKDAENESIRIALLNPSLSDDEKSQIDRDETLRLAMTYAHVLNDPTKEWSTGIVSRATQFKKDNPLDYVKGYAYLGLNVKTPKYVSKDPNVQAKIDLQTSISNEHREKLANPPPSFFDKMSKFIGAGRKKKTKRLAKKSKSKKYRSNPKHKTTYKPIKKCKTRKR